MSTQDGSRQKITKLCLRLLKLIMHKNCGLFFSGHGVYYDVTR